MELTKSEITNIRHLEDEYGLNVASIGSPIGKVKLLDVEDGTKNRFVTVQKVSRATMSRRPASWPTRFEDQAHPRILVLSPQGGRSRGACAQAVDQLGQIAETVHRSDLTFGLEVEANLVGQNGQLMAELHRQVDHPAMVMIFDGGNISDAKATAPIECFEQYQAMKTGLGWIHVKDYRHPHMKRTGHVDEDRLKHFVPADRGDSGHDLMFRELRESLRAGSQAQKRGIPGVFVDLEPHVKGGGQFGGFSGPDGLGVALRGLCRVLDYFGIGYHLRDFEDVCCARGF